jgi:glycine reductase
MIVTIENLNVGIVVSRAFHYPPIDPYSIQEATDFLTAKLDDIINSITKKESKQAQDNEDVSPPEKEVVIYSISGIDIMDLEDAVRVLWKNGVYAESGMGCTGPIVLVNESKSEIAIDILRKAGYASQEKTGC